MNETMWCCRPRWWAFRTHRFTFIRLCAHGKHRRAQPCAIYRKAHSAHRFDSGDSTLPSSKPLSPTSSSNKSPCAGSCRLSNLQHVFLLQPLDRVSFGVLASSPYTCDRVSGSRYMPWLAHGPNWHRIAGIEHLLAEFVRPTTVMSSLPHHEDLPVSLGCSSSGRAGSARAPLVRHAPLPRVIACRGCPATPRSGASRGAARQRQRRAPRGSAKHPRPMRAAKLVCRRRLSPFRKDSAAREARQRAWGAGSSRSTRCRVGREDIVILRCSPSSSPIAAPSSTVRDMRHNTNNRNMKASGWQYPFIRGHVVGENMIHSDVRYRRNHDR